MADKDILTQVREALRVNPDITGADLKKRLGGSQPVAFFNLLLQQAREAEAKIAEQLANEAGVAEESDNAGEDDGPAPTFWIQEPEGNLVELDYHTAKREMQIFRRKGVTYR
jgi:hypothetical protein